MSLGDIFEIILNKKKIEWEQGEKEINVIIPRQVGLNVESVQEDVR